MDIFNLGLALMLILQANNMLRTDYHNILTSIISYILTLMLATLSAFNADIYITSLIQG